MYKAKSVMPAFLPISYSQYSHLVPSWKSIGEHRGVTQTLYQGFKRNESFIYS